MKCQSQAVSSWVSEISRAAGRCTPINRPSSSRRSLPITALSLSIEYANSPLGIPVTKVDITSDVQFDATCTGYSWTTTYGAGTDTEYVDVEVRLVCESVDGVPYYVLETGSGKDSAHALRRIVRSFTISDLWCGCLLTYG